jgi:hypothetical protein
MDHGKITELANLLASYSQRAAAYAESCNVMAGNSAEAAIKATFDKLADELGLSIEEQGQ